MKKIKITVKAITTYKELMKEFENPISHACALKIGDTFLSINGKNLKIFVIVHGLLLNRLLKI